MREFLHFDTQSIYISAIMLSRTGPRLVRRLVSLTEEFFRGLIDCVFCVQGNGGDAD